MTFGQYYNTLHGFAKTQFRKDVIDILQVEEKTFYNWINETSSPTIKKREMLKKIFGVDFLFTTDSNIKKVKLNDTVKI